jgi:hypothetical protein
MTKYNKKNTLILQTIFITLQITLFVILHVFTN